MDNNTDLLVGRKAIMEYLDAIMSLMDSIFLGVYWLHRVGNTFHFNSFFGSSFVFKDTANLQIGRFVYGSLLYSSIIQIKPY